jgi:hypothetical protein
MLKSRTKAPLLICDAAGSLESLPGVNPFCWQLWDKGRFKKETILQIYEHMRDSTLIKTKTYQQVQDVNVYVKVSKNITKRKAQGLAGEVYHLLR